MSSNSSAPLVTIGVSLKNPGRPFTEALQSIFAQTFTDWELLLFDDMSSDGSQELCDSLDDPRVRVLRDGREMGLNIRLNQMIDASRGRYFFRMDADDVMHPERVAKQVEVLDLGGPDLVLGTSCYSIDISSRILGYRPAVGTGHPGFAARHTFIHPTVAAPTCWFRKHRYAERFPYFRSEDAELWCRTAPCSDFRVLAEPLLFYREGSSSFVAYIGTEMALIHMLSEYFAEPRSAYLRHTWTELAKIGIAVTLKSFGRFDWYVRRRLLDIRRLKPPAASAAQTVLRSVQQIELPVATHRPSALIA